MFFGDTHETFLLWEIGDRLGLLELGLDLLAEVRKIEAEFAEGFLLIPLEIQRSSFLQLVTLLHLLFSLSQLA